MPKQTPINQHLAGHRRKLGVAVAGASTLAIVGGSLIAHAGTDPYQKLLSDAMAINAAQAELANIADVELYNPTALADFQAKVDAFVTLVENARPDDEVYQEVLDKLKQDADQVDGSIPAYATSPEYNKYLAQVVAYQKAVAAWIADNESSISQNQFNNTYYTSVDNAARSVTSLANEVYSTRDTLQKALTDLQEAVNDSNYADWGNPGSDNYSYPTFVANHIGAVQSALTAFDVAASKYASAVGTYNNVLDSARNNGWEGDAKLLNSENYYTNIFQKTHDSAYAAISEAEGGAALNQGDASVLSSLAPLYNAAKAAYDEYAAAIEAQDLAEQKLAAAVSGFPTPTSATDTTPLDNWLANYQAAYADLQTAVADTNSKQAAYQAQLAAYINAGSKLPGFDAQNQLATDSAVVNGKFTNPGQTYLEALPTPIADAVAAYLAYQEQSRLYEAANAAMQTLNTTALAADANLHKAFNGLDSGDILTFRTQLNEFSTDLSNNALDNDDVSFMLDELMPHLQSIVDEVDSLSVTPTAAELNADFANYQATAAAYNDFVGSEVFPSTNGNGYSGLFAPLQAINNEYRQLDQPALNQGHSTHVSNLTQRTLSGWLDVFYEFVADNADFDASSLTTDDDSDWPEYLDMLNASFAEEGLDIYDSSAWDVTQAIYGTSYPHYQFNFPAGFKPLEVSPLPPKLPKLIQPQYSEIEISPVYPPTSEWHYIELKFIPAGADKRTVQNSQLPVSGIPSVPNPLQVNPVGVHVQPAKSPLTRTGSDTTPLAWASATLAAGAAMLISVASAKATKRYKSVR